MARPRLFSFCALVIPQDKEAHDGPPLRGTRGLGLVKFLRWLAFSYLAQFYWTYLASERFTTYLGSLISFLIRLRGFRGRVSVEKRLYYSKTMAKIGSRAFYAVTHSFIKPLNVHVDQEQKAEPRQNELSSDSGLIVNSFMMSLSYSVPLASFHHSRFMSLIPRGFNSVMRLSSYIESNFHDIFDRAAER